MGQIYFELTAEYCLVKEKLILIYMNMRFSQTFLNKKRCKNTQNVNKRKKCRE